MGAPDEWIKTQKQFKKDYEQRHAGLVARFYCSVRGQKYEELVVYDLEE